MNQKTAIFWLVGVGCLLLAALFGIRTACCSKRPTKLASLQLDLAIPRGVRLSQESLDLSPHGAATDIVKRRKVDLKEGDLNPLDWSVEELDEFLKTKASELNSRDLAKLMDCLFPDPAGGKNRPHQLKAGSIPLVDQMRLCEVYLDAKDHQIVTSGIWARYRSTEMVDEYRRVVIGRMLNGPERALAISDYYSYSCDDYSAIKELLTSDELLELRAGDTAVGGGFFSDYASATGVIEEKLQSLLEQGEVSIEDIVANLNASNLDEAKKLQIIRAIKKRGAEVERLLQQAAGNQK
jgi:hypothetical protein